MTDGQMETLAVEYLKDCKPREHRRLTQAGELQGYLDEKIAACKRIAQSLMDEGTFENQAWHWAARVVLLESPMD